MNPAMETGLWSAAAAMAATNGHTDAEWRAAGVSIDSRKVTPGDLFVAIRGPRFDGHDFAADALAADAAAVVVDHRPDGLDDDAPLLMVNETTTALEDLGRAARKRTDAKIIAVTGSVGKTGTKEALRFVLEQQGPCVASQGSFNNHWGVPLSLSRMPADTAFGIFEIGMSHAGEITPLTKMVSPHVAVITNVEAVHSAHFDTIEAIADAKAEIFQGLAPDGAAVINRDSMLYDHLLAAADAANIKNVIGFGGHPEARVRLTQVGFDPEGSTIDGLVDGEKIKYRLGLPGRHWAMNSLAVLAAVHAAGGDVSLAAAALADMPGLKGRGLRHRVAMKGGSFIVIDESYNASPVSMRAALEILGRMQPEGDGRRIAVLGDMLELGELSQAAHVDLAETLAAEKIDLVFTAGPSMAALWEALAEPMRGAAADSAVGVLASVTDAIRPGDVVVVKGSAGSKTGPIVEALLDLGAPCDAGPTTHRRAVNG
ncbi:MAG: UDP-N-acetylmuramoylalanyl-D-glutamyl-2,6-diaminopimelate--D-alanyl-D-alanine ligase [Proteobacteria bacterium]|nr:UDP-N-acetylmuramoylalanyl-D-glutamyl-2,6-diaminopimelate--D-alanyl-D-alanine ligase [Pseudomonadota bacterium]